MVWRLALGLALWLCSAQASAQLAAVAQEPDGFRERMRRGTLSLELGDLANAESAYGMAYRLWPTAEAQWGLGRVACARANYGDCQVWLRAALDAAVLPLSIEQRESALSLLRVAEETKERASAPRAQASVIVLSQGAGASLGNETDRIDFEAHDDPRITLWAVASMVVVAALAGVLVGVTAQTSR